jgi:hypothetical protein
MPVGQPFDNQQRRISGLGFDLPPRRSDHPATAPDFGVQGTGPACRSMCQKKDWRQWLRMKRSRTWQIPDDGTTPPQNGMCLSTIGAAAKAHAGHGP